MSAIVFKKTRQLFAVSDVAHNKYMITLFIACQDTSNLQDSALSGKPENIGNTMRNRGQRLQRITFNIDFEEQLLTDNKELEGLGFNK